MAYIKDDIIAAADFNAFSDQLDLVYGVGFGDSGYGQTTFSLITVAADDTIQSAEWTALVNASEVCADHQLSTINMPPTTEVAVSRVVKAHESDPPTSNPFDIDSSLNTLTTNRLVAPVASMSLFTNFLNSTRTTAWSAQLVHLFTMTFATGDDARHYFNSGGEIKMRGSRSGGAGTSQNADWTALLTSLGSGVVFKANTTIAPIGTPATTIGYFQLTTSFQQIFTVNSGYINYAANDITMFARTQDGPGGNGDRGRILEFRVEYNDDHTNAFFDQVDGTITSDIDIFKATAFLTIASPTAATLTGLSAGS